MPHRRGIILKPEDRPPRIKSMNRSRCSRPGWLVTLRLAFYVLLALIPFIASAIPVRAQVAGPVFEVQVDGVMSRYALSYLRRAVHEAEAADATALIIRLSSEGAVLRDVRRFAAEVADAQVPIVVYVTPSGTRSGAAGALLLSASHIAAMAPDTSFGAGQPLAEPDPGLTEQTRELFVNEVIDQLGAWNRTRGRSDAWIDQAVRTGAMLSNEQAIALDPPAVDIVVRDDDELLTALEGRLVTLADGSQHTLTTLGRQATPITPSFGEQLLLFLASPTVAFLLLIMAGMAIYAEIVSPTIGLLAGIGVILLIASFAGLLALPVHWISVIGLVFAFGLIMTDLFVPTHGALTVLGLATLVVSALTLIDAAQAPGVAVAVWAIVIVAVLIAGFAALGIYLAVHTRNTPVTTGQEGLVGRMAEVRKRLEPEGMVFVEGALWRAISEDGDVEPGEWVRVTGIYELRLSVRRLDGERR